MLSSELFYYFKFCQLTSKDIRDCVGSFLVSIKRVTGSFTVSQNMLMKWDC